MSKNRRNRNVAPLTLKQHVDHWVSSSDESLRDMESALKSNRRMNAMYCGHLSVEKIFKALLAAKNIEIEWEHNLIKLANLCNITLNNQQQIELSAINQFNIAAKYSSVKSQVYAQCSPQYAAQWAQVIRNWRKTLKQQVLTIRATLPNNTKASYPENRF